MYFKQSQENKTKLLKVSMKHKKRVKLNHKTVGDSKADTF